MCNGIQWDLCFDIFKNLDIEWSLFIGHALGIVSAENGQVRWYSSFPSQTPETRQRNTQPSIWVMTATHSHPLNKQYRGAEEARGKGRGEEITRPRYVGWTGQEEHNRKGSPRIWLWKMNVAYKWVQAKDVLSPVGGKSFGQQKHGDVQPLGVSRALQLIE